MIGLYSLFAIALIGATLCGIVWIVFRALLKADEADRQTMYQPQQDPVADLTEPVSKGQDMKSQNPYHDIFVTLQGRTFEEATEILEAVLRCIRDVSANQTLTPEIVEGLDLERPRRE